MVEECDVLVVGAGPAGVVAGLLLGDAGVGTVVVDRRLSVSELPRARGIHARATEILRRLGIEDDMVAHALPVDARAEVRSSLAEPPLAVVATGGSTWSQVSPCEGIAISQDVFEGVLRAHLARRETVSLRLGQRLVDLDVGDPGRRPSATFADEATGETSTVTASFIVGADGWRSDVRRLCGIDVIGNDDLGRLRSIRFRADLSPWLGSPPPAFLRFPQTDAVLFATHPDDRWVLIIPADGPGAAASPEAVVRRVLGVESPVEVLGDNGWVAAVQHASRFQAGRVFLIGDAAHRVTPAGATGISSAMADAHNLAWKLTAELEGWAGPQLLASFDTERRAVAAETCAQNLTVWRQTQAGQPFTADLRMLDMGYRYRSEIVSQEEVPAMVEEPGGGGAERSEYRPSAAPGCRAPHAWLGEAGGRVSTLDHFGRGFTLVTGDSGEVWEVAASTRSAAGQIPLGTLRLDDPAAQGAYGLGAGGAVLVRPDGHVAWRTRSNHSVAGREPSDALTSALVLAAGSAATKT